MTIKTHRLLNNGKKNHNHILIFEYFPCQTKCAGPKVNLGRYSRYSFNYAFCPGASGLMMVTYTPIIHFTFQFLEFDYFQFFVRFAD